MAKHAIITGGAGFIGSHLVDLLMQEDGWCVSVLDNFHPAYPRAVKEANIAPHHGRKDFDLVEGDILDNAAWEKAFAAAAGLPTVVVHLAALAGVRASMADPLAYHRVNVTGSLMALEAAKRHGAVRFIQASSSSVYGEHPGVPWTEDLRGLRPISPYAVSKLAAEEFARVSARLYGLDTVVLRFFTVHGPRQRPDLAIHSFFHKILHGIPIQRFGDGSTRRDHTYVGDAVQGLRAAMDKPLPEAPGTGRFALYNIGNSSTTSLSELITAIEREAGRQAIMEALPEQAGDVRQTLADLRLARRDLGYAPSTSLAEGLHRFHLWYREAQHLLAPTP
jgi:UDP-glucuronate 4-epimerase